jgi:hypothetical protein
MVNRAPKNELLDSHFDEESHRPFCHGDDSLQFSWPTTLYFAEYLKNILDSRAKNNHRQTERFVYLELRNQASPQEISNFVDTADLAA